MSVLEWSGHFCLNQLMWNRLIELLEIGLPKPFPFRVSAKHLFQSPDTVMKPAPFDAGECAGYQTAIDLWLDYTQYRMMKYAPRIEMLFDYLPDFAGIGLDFLRCVLARREVKRQNHELKFTEFLKLSLIVPCDIAVRDMKHPAALTIRRCDFPFCAVSSAARRLSIVAIRSMMCPSRFGRLPPLILMADS